MERVAHPGWKPFAISLSALMGIPIFSYFKLPYGFIGVVTSFVLLQLFLHQVYIKAFERVARSVIAAVVGVVIINVLYPWPILAFGLLAVCLFFLIYYFFEELHDYGMLFAGLTLALLVTFAFFDGKAKAYEFAVYWGVDLLIGALIAVVLGFCFSLKTGFKVYPLHHADTRLMDVFSRFNPISALVALRVVGAIATVITLQYHFKETDTTIQALIAAMVVAVQRQVGLVHHRIVFRIVGVVIGAAIALSYGYLEAWLMIPYLTGILMVLTLGIFSWLSQKCPAYLEYFFVQASVMLPIILMTSAGGEAYNHTIGLARALGSIEGGVIGLVWVYLFYLPIRKFEKMQMRSKQHV